MKRGIIGVVACTAALALAVPALAIDFSGYGAVRVGTYWTQNTYYNSNAANGPVGAKRSDSDFSLDLFGDSLVGVRAKEGDFSAVAEMGAFNPKAEGKGPEVRLLFGEWDFGQGKIRVGKAPSPYVYRTQMAWDSDGGMNAYGSLWDGRYAQIKLTMNNGFYIDLMQPRTGASSNVTTNLGSADAAAEFGQTGNTYTNGYINYNTVMPKIVVGYEGQWKKWAYGGGVSYNLYNVEYHSTSAASQFKTDIHAYLVFFHGQVDLSPVEFSYNIFTGRNLGDLMSSAASAYVTSGGGGSGYNVFVNGPTAYSNTSYPGAQAAAGTGAYYDVFNKVDAYTYGGWAQVGYTVNPKLKVYVGASFVSDDNKITRSDDRLAVFANAQYQVSKNFKIVPEIGFLNDMYSTTGAKEPRTLLAGAKWEMSF